MMNKMTEEGAACMHNVQCTTQTWFATPHAAAFSQWVAWLKKGRKEGRGREREKGSCSLPLHVEASATTRGKSFFAATVGTK